jgi:type I restriction enzyme S subunit
VVSHLAQQQVPEGYQQTEVGVIPQDWSVFELGSITQTQRPISYGIVQTGPRVSGGVKCLRVVDISNGVISRHDLITTTIEISNSYKRTQLQLNDLVIPLRGKVGEVGIVDEDLIGENLTRGVALIALKGSYNAPYVKQIISFEGSARRLENSMNGSALQEIPIATLRSFKVAIPPKTEQTAIANALSDVDALITSLEKLIAKKRAIKTAAMQQLLTGKKRLPPFDQAHTGYKKTELGEIPEDWGIRTIESISSVPMQNGLFYEPSRKGRGVRLIKALFANHVAGQGRFNARVSH